MKHKHYIIVENTGEVEEIGEFESFRDVPIEVAEHIAHGEGFIILSDLVLEMVYKKIAALLPYKDLR